MNDWQLPLEVEVCGRRFAIRSDFRAVLDALAALQDPALSARERAAACLGILYPDWRALPDAAAAFTAAMTFINLGSPAQQDAPPGPVLVDWNRDAQLIAPAVDRVLGYSCRQAAYLHWWEFIGAYMSIGQGLFAQVVAIRDKKARGKPLDKYERRFAAAHAALCRTPGSRLTDAEQAFLRQLGVD